MAMQVLFTSTGFAMYEHLCLVKREKTVSFIHEKKCQPEFRKTADANTHDDAGFRRGKCCLNKVSYYKIQTPSASVSSAQFEDGQVDLAPVFCPHDALSPLSVNPPGGVQLLHFAGHAPPLYGRSMLIFVQSFLL